MLCLRGYHQFVADGVAKDSEHDCFAVSIGFTSADGHYLIGSLTGQDDEGTSGMVCSFVLTRLEKVPTEELSRSLHAARMRTMLKSDIKFDK